MKTINFCGDSFCQKEHKSLAAWTKLLAYKLEAKIIGFGKGASAHEHAIQTFDNTADYTVFCWTDPYRLYVDKTYSTNLWTLEAMINPDKLGLSSAVKLRQPTPTKIDKAAYTYYKYLYRPSLHEQRQIRDLYWFDNVVLSNYKGIAVHIFCFKYRINYKFQNGIYVSDILSHKTKKHKFRFVNHWLLSNKEKQDILENGDMSTEYANHMTKHQNFELADKIYSMLNLL